jgi:hypothetical protein
LAVKPAQENKAGAYGMQYSIKPAAAAGVLNAPPAVLEKAGGLSEASAPKKCTGSAGEMKVPLEVRNTVLNPAKGEVVQIKYRLYAAGPVLIRVYDRKGRMIRTICRDEKAAGIYEELWKCDDDGGSIVNAGIYILYVKTAGTEQKIKIGIIK